MSKMFKCALCPVEYKFEAHLKNHVEREHGGAAVAVMSNKALSSKQEPAGPPRSGHTASSKRNLVHVVSSGAISSKDDAPGPSGVANAKKREFDRIAATSAAEGSSKKKRTHNDHNAASDEIPVALPPPVRRVTDSQGRVSLSHDDNSVVNNLPTLNNAPLDLEDKEIRDAFEDATPRLLRNPDGKWKELANVYHAQHNVAVVLEMLMDRKKLVPGNFGKLHVLCIGPSSTDLRSQTESRLNEALLVKLGAFQSTFADVEVMNSSSLPRSYDNMKDKNPAIQFLNDLVTISQDFFLVVHDEMHWGITEDSSENNSTATLVINFLNKLHEACEAVMQRRNTLPPLALLLVSATPFALSFTTPFSAVSWSRAMKLKSQFYRPTSYLPWYQNDLKWEKAKHDKVCLNSEAITSTYINPTGTAELILNQLDDVNTQCSAVFRAASVNDADTLYNHLSRLYYKKYYVLNLSGPAAADRVNTIRVQIAAQDSNFKIANSKDVEQFLDSHNCLIIVVERFAMGETLTRRVKFYDIRARYSSKMSGTMDAIIQDIGRVAGHGKQPCTVYHSVEGLDLLAAYFAQHGMSSATLKAFKADAEKRKHDKTAQELKKKYAAVLTPIDTAGKNNPQSDKNSQVYSKLSSMTVLLEAEPQLGKTGVIATLLFNLRRRSNADMGRVMKWMPVNETRGGYVNPNPDVKIEINKLLRKHLIEDKPLGDIIFLDHTTFGTASVLAGMPVDTSLVKRFHIPQMDRKVFEEMKKRVTFGARVSHNKLDAAYLESLPNGPIALLYADFCGAINNAIHLFENKVTGQQLDISRFTHNSLIAITICARSPLPAQFTNSFAFDLYRYLHDKLGRMFFLNQLYCNCYGENMRMATVAFRLEKIGTIVNSTSSTAVAKSTKSSVKKGEK